MPETDDETLVSTTASFTCYSEMYIAHTYNTHSLTHSGRRISTCYIKVRIDKRRAIN